MSDAHLSILSIEPTGELSAPASVLDTSLQRLRQAITSGVLKPGQKLIEAELCRALGISRPTLREALRSLESERLVELVPNRGPFVTKLGRREIEDIHDVWAMLTGEAGARFTTLATPADITELQEALDRLRAAIVKADVARQIAAVDGFFKHILSRCDNSMLAEMVDALVSRILFLRAHALQQKGWGLLCAEEIEDVLSGVRAKCPAQVRQTIRKHINSACQAARQSALTSKDAPVAREFSPALWLPRAV